MFLFLKQNTKQYSRSEVVRFLEDRDEKSAAYDKLIEEQKANKAAAVEAQSRKEAEAAHKAREQMMLHAAKTDLAIRTGKATLKLEEYVAGMKAEAAAAMELSEKRVEQVVQNIETVDVDSVVAQDNLAEEELIATTEVTRKIKLSTATFEPVTDEVIDAHNKEIKSEKEKDDEVATASSDPIDNVIANLVAREIAEREESSEQTENETDTESKEPQEAEDKTVSEEKTSEVKSAKKKASKIKLNNPVLRGQVVVRDGEKRLTGDLAKLFRKYREMPGIEAQLIDFFENIDEEINTPTSKTGNLIISGNSSSDKIDLARTIVRAINFLYPDKAKKIAKTTGDSINSRGIEKAMPKLMGTALIVEEAGSIQPKRVKEMLACLSQDTGGMIAIFEDSDAEMNVLINFNPDLVNSFNHRIVLKQYTVNELVELARKYANKKQYEIDEDALLELYLKIDALHNATESIRLDDIKEIINKAIENAIERGSKKKFVLMKRTITKSGMNYLLAQDFKD
ncbi:MAG: hypothetical protein IJB96_11390 [Lachnospira sp.]|nr:hypothetical protein [Lachnospira sp.]